MLLMNTNDININIYYKSTRLSLSVPQTCVGNRFHALAAPLVPGRCMAISIFDTFVVPVVPVS
jgi:hypothetical protein